MNPEVTKILVARVERKKPAFNFLPEGGFIVKENYMPDGKLDAITIMYRVNGYNPDAGDWFWAKYSAAGGVDASGKVAGCIGCHTAVKDNDWVFIGPVK